MSGRSENEKIRHDEAPASDAEQPEDSVYRYRDSGIVERHGRIPLWLAVVAVSLIVWGIYYTIRFWSAP